MNLLNLSTKKQLLGFVVTGMLSTLIMFVLYVILCRILNYQWAYLIAYSSSVVVLYFMNSAVFKRKISVHTFLGFPLIYLLQYLVGAASLALLVRLGFSVTFAPLFIVLALLPITFILNRIVFTRL